MNAISYVASTVTDAVVSRAKKAYDIIPSCALEVIIAIPVTAVGLAATPFAALTCGKVKPLYWLAVCSTYSTPILPNIFTVAMKILNPNCKIDNHKKIEGTFQKLVAVSLLTFGSNPEINGFASNQLKSFGSIFSDVSIHLRAAFNPSAINGYGTSVNV